MFDRLLPLLAVEEAQEETRQQVDDAHMHSRHAENVHRAGGHIVLAHFIGEVVIVAQQDGRCHTKLIVAQPAALQRPQQDIAKPIGEGIDGVGIVRLQVDPVVVFQIDLPRDAFPRQISPIVELLGVQGRRHFTDGCGNGNQVTVTQSESRIRPGEISHHLARDRARRQAVAELVFQFEHRTNGVRTLCGIVVDPSHIIARTRLMIAEVISLHFGLVHARQRTACHEEVASHDGAEKPLETDAFCKD